MRGSGTHFNPTRYILNFISIIRALRSSSNNVDSFEAIASTLKFHERLNAQTPKAPGRLPNEGDRDLMRAHVRRFRPDGISLPVVNGQDMLFELRTVVFPCTCDGINIM